MKRPNMRSPSRKRVVRSVFVDTNICQLVIFHADGLVVSHDANHLRAEAAN